MQELAWLLTVILIAVVAGAFLLIKRRSAMPAEYEPVQRRAYRIRTLLFSLLVIVGIPAMTLTLVDLPYVPADAEAAPQVVAVTGHQWYWELDREKVAAGQPVEFLVTSADVNHGMGIYDSETRLLAQTQAMPGYVNRLRYTFQTPGTYRLMCLEYCGLAHHEMIAELSVVAP